MSNPTVASPWYVVQKFRYETREVYYYTSSEEPGDIFDDNPKHAMLFTSLASAARVAAAEGAHIRVLVSAEDAEEFGRKE